MVTASEIIKRRQKKNGSNAVPSPATGRPSATPSPQTVKATPTPVSCALLEKTGKLPSYDKVAVDTTSTILNHIEELPSYPYIAIDTETTGLERDAKLLGASFCGEAGKAYWLPAENIVPFVMEATLAGKQLIMNYRFADSLRSSHNAKFDLQVLARNSISLYGNPIFDTMIAHQLLDENERHGLKHLAKTILGAKVNLEQSPMIETPLFDIDDSQLVEYACADADYTFQLYQRFAEQLKQENLSRLFYTVEMPLVKIVAKMEDTGILVDAKKLAGIAMALKEESKAIVHSVYALAGEPFDINSPVQLCKILFDKLGLKSVKETLR